MPLSQIPTDAEKQFNTSSLYRTPEGYTPWKIRNEYPSSAQSDATWHDVDPIRNPEEYIEIIKDYCLKGMVESDFVPQNNKERQWYHAPWMHYSTSGREPLRGLTSERYIPPREFSATQERYTQTWAVGFFNAVGAPVLEEMWRDPNNPQWKGDKNFPWDTVIYKLLFSNATNNDLLYTDASTGEQLPLLEGAPRWQGMIAVQPEDPSQSPNPAVRVTSAPNEVRLLQMDVAIKDTRAKATGWLWGTFMYVSPKITKNKRSGFKGLYPVGLAWDNDPKFNQAAYESNPAKLEGVWINPEVDRVRIGMNGRRPFWGWNGRLNGPADNFISACQSCHSTAQWNFNTQSQGTSLVAPAPIVTANGLFEPNNDKVTMTWFTNVPAGKPITKGAFSADNSLQLMIGYENYVAWREKNEWEQGGKQGPPPVDKRPTHRRQGPEVEF